MKKILTLLASSFLTLICQAKNEPAESSSSPRWCTDAKFMVGNLSQNLSTINTDGNYLEAVRARTGMLSVSNGITLGATLQAGYFFGKRRNWGVGTGIIYLAQKEDVTLEYFHAEFRATDSKGNAFRQHITMNGLREHVTATNINIPLVIKYKTSLTKNLGFTADFGVLFNVQATNSYQTTASFDYEAVYKFVGTNPERAVYDNGAVPDMLDLLLTKSSMLTSMQLARATTYFDTLYNRGYNVGLNKGPKVTSGKNSYKERGPGFMIAPALTVNMSPKISLNLGCYFIVQSWKGTPENNYQITGAVGTYSSPLNTVSTGDNLSYGLNLGGRILIGR